MNLELLKLQLTFRQLYERLGASDAEALIAQAFAAELARHEAKLHEQALAGEKSYGRSATLAPAEPNDIP